MCFKPNLAKYSFCCLLFLSNPLFCVPINKELQTVLNSIEKIRQQEEIAAVGIAIIEDSQPVWLGGLGTLAHDSDIPISDNTIFRIGSITKSFTSLAILKLAEQGKLELNKDISRWVPSAWYQNTWGKEQPVKIAQLLEHTAGFRDISKAEFDYNDPPPASLEKNLLRFKQTHTVAWPAGMHASYTNLGAGFAGYIIERSSDSNYESYVAEQIFQPLDMSESGFFISGKNRARLAAGYDTDGRTGIPYWHMIYRPFGGINTTLSDMISFLQMLINKGRHKNTQVFKRESIERMEVPHTSLAARNGLTFGYGLGNYQWLQKGILFHGHGGDADGYLSHYGYTRRNNNGYFLVISAFNYRALSKIRTLIEDYLIRDLDKPTTPAIKILSKHQINQLTGTYQNVTARFANNISSRKLTILVDGDSLYTRANNNKKIRLIPVTDKHFRREGETIATIAIVQASDENIYYQSEYDNFRKMR